jgi:hypothetical protein
VGQRQPLVVVQSGCTHKTVSGPVR